MAHRALRRAALLAIAPLGIALALQGVPSGSVHAALPDATLPIVLPTALTPTAPSLATLEPPLPTSTPKLPLPTPTNARPTPTLPTPTPTPTLPTPTLVLPTIALPTPGLPTLSPPIPTPSASPPPPTPEPSPGSSVVPSGSPSTRSPAPPPSVGSPTGGAGLLPPADAQGGRGTPGGPGAGGPRHEIDPAEGSSPLDRLMSVDIPSVTLGVSAILILALVGAQVAGAISFLPIVRRQLGPGRARRRRRD
jgi:hypothetical protein